MDKATGSTHNNYPSLYRKIRWSFGTMIMSLFTLCWIVIYVAQNQLEIISLHHWLDTETNRYIQTYKQDGIEATPPNESEFSSYWSEGDLSIPAWLTPYTQPGFYEYQLGEEDKHFTVIEHPSGRGMMYIVFQDDADDYLDEYEDSLHLYTFIIGGLITLGMLLYSMYFMRTLARPLVSIEQKITFMSPDKPSFSVDSEYSETRKIEQTLLDSKNDIAGYFQREQEFSRFASHELRTPIMIIKGSTAILQKVPDQPHVALKAINRLNHASDEMTLLTETFLLLGKESIDPHHFAYHALEHLVQQQLDEMAPLFAKQDSNYTLTSVNPSKIYAPESFITIIINNLIKNAFSYSIGNIGVNLTNNTLTITNRHDGNETYNAGYGCGLVIVERICERMHWSFTSNDSGTAFTTSIHFVCDENPM
ncbi:sensor histidine kinase [Photobacterium profundum]|uniref:sensor histidine kinase n=1 Tax=Photobacterium profundum TaxID=74109 RepID=UPI003D10FD88